VNIGKSMRLRRIMDSETGTTVMFAFSHGTSAPSSQIRSVFSIVGS